MLLKSPGLALAAILSLAIGIGANTALFSVVNGLLLRPLPYPDPDRLALIWLHSPGLGILQDWPSPGQYIDLKHGPEFQLRHLHEMKTGRLIAASVECVLLLEGLAEAATIPYRRFAAELGVLFQIVDDILDVTGTDDAWGKPRGSDERHGKRTYVSEFGIDRARELAADSRRMALDALAEAAGRSRDTGELEAITDFIYTRTS